jgi:hypothetical protein
MAVRFLDEMKALPHDQDRARGMPDNYFGYAAKLQRPESAHASAADDYNIKFVAFRDIGNNPGWLALFLPNF